MYFSLRAVFELLEIKRHFPIDSCKATARWPIGDSLSAMSSGGPYKVYPYPVQGVIYDAPPWAADYVGNVGAIAYRANVEGHGGHDTGDESEYDDDAMDIDDDNDQAQGQDSVDVAMMDLQKPDALSSGTSWPTRIRYS